MMLHDAFLRAPIAHRGYHAVAEGRPENTMGAFEAAIAAGYGIEMDIQPSADGVPMVFHDDVLDRLVGRAGPVSSLTAAELRGAKVLGSDYGVPTLSEVLSVVAGRVPLLIEVKDQSRAFAPVDGALERAVAEVLKGHDGPVALMSFNPHSVAALAGAAPDIPRGLTTCSYDEDWFDDLPPARIAELKGIPDYTPTGSSFLSHEYRDLANPRVRALKDAGAAILCWTVKSPEAEAEARRLADNVTFELYPAPIRS